MRMVLRNAPENLFRNLKSNSKIMSSFKTQKQRVYTENFGETFSNQSYIFNIFSQLALINFKRLLTLKVPR